MLLWVVRGKGTGLGPKPEGDSSRAMMQQISLDISLPMTGSLLDAAVISLEVI